MDGWNGGLAKTGDGWMVTLLYPRPNRISAKPNEDPKKKMEKIKETSKKMNLMSMWEVVSKVIMVPVY